MKYYFIDESGTVSLRDKRPFVVAMVIFDSLDKVYGMQEKIRRFRERNNIPQDYEFHYSRNAKVKKEKFTGFIKREVEKYRIFKVRKNGERDIYSGIVEMMVSCFSKQEKHNIRLDDNPQLFKALRTKLREEKVKAKIVQEESRRNDIIQIADYLAGIASEE